MLFYLLQTNKRLRLTSCEFTLSDVAAESEKLNTVKLNKVALVECLIPFSF